MPKLRLELNTSLEIVLNGNIASAKRYSSNNKESEENWCVEWIND